MRGSRICVIGAGAGGLAAAYHLNRRGYRHVRVLEKRDRIGGLCDSFTYDQVAFDLGGNYVLPNYTHVRSIAEEVGAQLTGSPDRITWDHTMNGSAGGLRSTLAGVLQGTNMLAFTLACGRYAALRERYADVLDAEGFRGVSAHPELCQPFSELMAEHDLEPMRNLFVIPITIMGYAGAGVVGEYASGDRDYLDEIPACYVMKYIDLATLGVLLSVGVGLPIPWPKRFKDGYQRFWQLVSNRLDVRLSADVYHVERRSVDGEAAIRVTYDYQGDTLHEEYDALVLACPLKAAATFMNGVEGDELSLYEAFGYNEYLIHMVEVEGLDNHIYDVMPITPFGHPWAIVKQWKRSNLCVTYTPSSAALTEEQARAYIEEDITKIGGRVVRFRDYRRWPYFPHLSTEQLHAGVYDRLEALQGKKHTFFTGNQMGFELAERATAYSQDLVERFFPVIHE